MMVMPYELSATLVNALNSFDFKGRTIWTLASGMKHVKVELTFLFDQPTDRRARAVKRSPAPTLTIRLRETAPPTTDVVTVTRPTVILQRPANSTTLIPPPTLRPPQQQQRITDLGATAKRRSQPAATSSQKNTAPALMEVDKIPPSIFDKNYHHKQIDCKKNDITTYFTFGKAWKYYHPTDEELAIIECRKADEKWEERKKSYIVRYGGIYRMFRQPGHLDYIPEWWNFLTTFQKESSLHQKKRASEVKDLLRHAKDGYLYVVTAPVPDPPRK